MRIWARFIPKTLRSKLLIMTLLMVSVPLTTTGIVVEMQGREARESEKLEKLFGLARILDGHLGPGFNQILADYDGPTDDRVAQILFLNARLRAFTDLIAQSNPGIGVGYYSKSLDAIITYGPSAEYHGTVGIAIPSSHPGRTVMATGEQLVRIGNLVRGPIMNAMWPITRDGEVIGYIWANELTASIDKQVREMDLAILAVTCVGILLGLLFAHALSRKLTNDILDIKNGLARMQVNLSHTIRRPSSELGEIADAVNAMAKALLGARTLNDNILNSIADGIIAVDGNGRVTSINPAAQHMMGIGLNDILGHPYQSLYDPNTSFASVLLDTLESGREHIGVPLECPLTDQVLHVNVSSSLLKDGAGHVIGAVAVLKDLSEQQRLQKQIMRADRLAALGELVAGVAHEIRNPLTSIRGFMQYLESSNNLEEWQHYAPLIVRQVDSLNRIVTELLEFGRHRPACVGSVRINTIIREMTVLAGAKTAARITLDLDETIPAIEADGEALKQAFLNLLINAIQAIPETGMVTISTAFDPASGEIVITVADNGVGIAREDMEKIFDPFFSTKPTGTGLGLPMVHRIMDAHHGSVAINSVPGTGTKVVLHLPIVQTAEPQEAL